MKSARKENKFSKLIELFQNLADDENRQKVESATINLARQKEAGNGTNESKREDNKRGAKKNKCSRCGRSSHSKEKCPIVNFECIEYHKIGH